MFSASVALNRNVSCGTKPIWRRTSAGASSRKSMPSSSTAPAVGSSSRGMRRTSVLLPLPVWPTMATVSPARESRRSIPPSANPAGYSTETPRNSISPRHRAERHAGFGRSRRENGGALIQDLVDAAQRRRAALHQVHHPAQRDHRPDQHSHVGVEHHEAAERDVAGKQPVAAHPQHDQEREADQRLQQRHEHAGDAREREVLRNVLRD